MRLLKLDVHAFGKLKDFVLEPKAGLNCYAEPNEFGKTTLIYFICWCFYGYDAKQFKKYLPWSGEDLSGSLLFEQNGRRWRIERRRAARGAEKCTVLCIDSGEALALAVREQPGPRFLGMDSATFLRSFCMMQDDLIFSRTDGLDVALKNLAGTGDENVSFRQAEEYLNKQHTLYMHRGKNQGNLRDWNEQQLADRERLSQLRQQMDARVAERREWMQLSEEMQAQEQAVVALEARCKQAAAGDAKRLLAKLEALEQAPQAEPPKVSKDQLAAWELADEEWTLTVSEHRAAVAAAERCDDQLRVMEKSLRQFGFHDRSAQDLEKLEKKVNPLPAVLAAILAIGAEVGALVASLWPLHLAAGVLLIAAIGLLLAGRLSKQQICHRYGAADEAQLKEKWAQYGKVQAECEALRENQQQCRTTVGEAEQLVHQAAERREALRAQTRILNKEELEQARIEWAVYENQQTHGTAKLQEQALLGGRTRAELTALAESAEPSEEGEAQVRALLQRAQERQRELIRRRDALGHWDLAALWQQEETLSCTIREREQQIEQGERALAAVKKSLSWLQAANEEMNTQFAPALCTQAGAYLSALTDGKYSGLLMDEHFSILVESAEGTYPVEQFSAGTKDAVYFSFRLAVGDLLSETPLPMVLDDPFVHLDEPRRKAAEAMLERISEKRQVLYFTCRA